MLSTNPTASPSSDSIMEEECQLENEDDWVIVGIQKFTILVPPPPSPPEKIQQHELLISGETTRADDDPPLIKSGISPRLVSVTDPNKSKANGIGKRVNLRKLRPVPVGGALNVVNRKLRIVSLERELRGAGGLRRWLEAKGLRRFVPFFFFFEEEEEEDEDVGKYRLANATMRTLKEMGINAVGPRRKLVNAVDSLCSPR